MIYLRLTFIFSCALFFFFFPIRAYSQAPNFNAQTQVIPYTSPFYFGVNSGYYGQNWNDTSTAKIAQNAGASTLRLGLFESFLETFGDSVNYKKYQFYNRSHFMDNTVFLNGAANDHTDNSIYNFPKATRFLVAANPSLVFKNLYDPIWNQDGSVNLNNYFAAYVYKVVTIYGSAIKFFEVWNEPDSYAGVGGSGLPGQPGNWYENPPAPQDLFNLNAPIYYYIRMLRIAYEVVHRYAPNSYVCTGGIGTPSFLDCLLRYTDNPTDGSFTADYSHSGGAYFDVLSFHDYPLFNVHAYSNALSKLIYFRHSDGAVSDYIRAFQSFQTLLFKYGYTGSKYPKKPIICTETNICSTKIITDTTLTGTPHYQANYMMKALIYSYKLGIAQLYSYALANNESDPNQATDPNAWMGLYNDIQRGYPGQENLTQEGIGYKTLSSLLKGYVYDSIATKKLNLIMDTLDGAAFTNGNSSRYVLWAKTHQDLNETVFHPYTLPQSLFPSGVKEYTWDASIKNLSYQTEPNRQILLTADPLILESVTKTDSNSLPRSKPIARAGIGHQTQLPNPSYLDGSISVDSGGTILQYFWKKITGPTGDRIDSSKSIRTKVFFTKSGKYNYQLKVLDNNAQWDSTTVEIIVYPPYSPIHSIIVSSNNLKTSTMDTLNGLSSTPSTGATMRSYTWKKLSGPGGDVLSSPFSPLTLVSFKYSGHYIYTLRVVDTFGNKDSSTIAFSVVAGSSGLNQFSVFPNPTSGRITLQYSNNVDGIGNVYLYTALGKLVYKSPFNKTQFTLTKNLDLTGLKAGIYILKLVLQGNAQTFWLQKL